MNFLADEGVEREIVEGLRARGDNVLYVAEMAPGIPDDEVLDMANRADAILIASDKDFGELVFRQRLVHHGVVLLRLHGLSAEGKSDTVTAAVANFGDQFRTAFSVLSPGIVRIRGQGT